MAKIVVDAGHGGSDFGAVFRGRQEKDDNLRLALAVGRILENNGQEVVYTRTGDIYQTPSQKAALANEAGADYFVSIHRNSSPMPGQYSGAESLVYQNSGIPAEMAENINSGLERAGFQNIGVSERPGLAVLRRTRMPAVLVEAGFINNENDNRIFDEEFDEIAQGIAGGLLDTILENGSAQELTDGDRDTGYRFREDVQREAAYEMQTPEGEEMYGLRNRVEKDSMYEEWRDDQGEQTEDVTYRVQTGAFVQSQNAEALLNQLLQQGFFAYSILEDGLYKVMVGEFALLDNAVKLENVLRRYGYNTFVTN